MRDAGVRTAPSQACAVETMATAGIRSRWGRGRGGLPTGAELRVGEAVLRRGNLVMLRASLGQ